MSQNLTKRSKRRERERQKRIRSILKAALEIFSEKGYDRTTTDEIADFAGLSKGLLYFYFGSKEDIFVSLLLDGMDNLIKRLQKNIKDQDSPEEQLVSFIRTEYDFYSSNLKFFKLLNSTYSGYVLGKISPENRQKFVAKHYEEVKILEKIFERGKREKVFKNIDTDDLIYSLAGLMHGLLIMKPGNKDLEKSKNLTIEVFLHGIKRGG